MSYEATNWAAYQKVGDPQAKSILMCLANRADETGMCYPGIAYIERITELSRRTIIRKIKFLEEKGYLRKQKRKVEGKKENATNLYFMPVPPPPEVVSQGHHPSVTQTPPLVSQGHHPSVTQTPNTSLKHQFKQNRLAKNAKGKSRSTPKPLPWDNDELEDMAKQYQINSRGMSTKELRDRIKNKIQVNQ
jgi:hypothetical protein